MREVYRKLAAALHPDRTPTGASDAERDERLALMKRANVAYEAGDLLALLGLQLQIEQVDASQLSRMEAHQVRHFNQVLGEQLRDLQDEVHACMMRLMEAYGVPITPRQRPDRLGSVITQEVAAVEAGLMALRHEQRLLRGPLKAARPYLRQQMQRIRHERAMEELLSVPFFEPGFDHDFEPDFEAPPRRRRR